VTQIWTTRDGTQIPVSEMTDSHLANAIAYLERTADARLAYETANLLSGPTPTGAMAQDAYEQGMQELFDMTPDDYLEQDDAYQALLAEKERRTEAI
jgi:hypothetical protein